MSFGLVLLATILLVVGLLSDDGINLIYLSIGASATAAVVLFLAFRLAKPKSGDTADAPTPLAEDEPDVTAVVPAVAPQAVAAAPAAPAAPPTRPAPAPRPAPEPEPEPVAADDDWADDTDWEVDDAVEFPIADYDDLTVSEIMPLLPQLYSDELDLVYERETDGKNRTTILGELEKLKVTGTEADALEAAAVDDEAVDPAPAPAPAPAPEPAPAPAAAPAPSPALLDDDDEDDGAFFPIADYDDLSVSQIVPLLSQLELDELEDVRAREEAGANRSTLLTEIDRYLSGELEAFSWDSDDEDEDEAPEAAPAVDPAAARLPIADYPELTVPEVVDQLDDLTPAQLEQVLAFESERDNRVGVVDEIDARLAAAPPATASRARRAPAKKAAANRPTKKKSATKRRATKKKGAARKTPAKKARKSTKKRASRFPIANYDELTVADIRPRLQDLSDNQLRQVRDRERSGAGRKTILDDIANRL